MSTQPPDAYLIPAELVGAVRAVAVSVLGSGTASLGVATIRRDWGAGDDAIEQLQATRALLDAIGWHPPRRGECDVLLDVRHRPALEMLARQLAENAHGEGLDQLAAGLLEAGETP
jgi:hypothetical protein